MAAPFLRPSRVAFIPSPCKNGDPTSGARIYAWWMTPRACRLRRARDNVQPREGWAVGETKKRKETHRDDGRPGEKRPSSLSQVEEEHRQQDQRKAEQTAPDRF